MYCLKSLRRVYRETTPTCKISFIFFPELKLSEQLRESQSWSERFFVFCLRSTKLHSKFARIYPSICCSYESLFCIRCAHLRQVDCFFFWWLEGVFPLIQKLCLVLNWTLCPQRPVQFALLDIWVSENLRTKQIWKEKKQTLTFEFV